MSPINDSYLVVHVNCKKWVHICQCIFNIIM